MPATIGRRELMAALGAAAVAWPVTASAQQQAMPVIGYVAGDFKNGERLFANVRRGLAELGYLEGQNFRFEFRDTNFQVDLIPIRLRGLAEQKVALIIASTTVQLAAAKAVTQSIPIVFYIGTDPVENGFVASFNRPGGNITGVWNLAVTLTGKRFEVLHETVPSATKFAFLTDPGNRMISELQIPLAQAAAHSLGLNLLNVNAHKPDEFEAVFETSVREGAGGMVVGADGLFFYPACTQLVALAARYRLPTIYVDDIAVPAGGLISYGTDQDEPQRLVGNYAGRILKGEKPADMPVQQATKARFIINLKTAKAMGITVPTPLLGRADEVIE
jgi:putative tryptophan/tyrosine transport system substrate-binding protein